LYPDRIEVCNKLLNKTVYFTYKFILLEEQ